MSVLEATYPRIATASHVVPHRHASQIVVRLALGALLGAQVLLALRPSTNSSVFEDEALYIFMGHRMLDHLLHGAFLSEFPGTYFSGSPGFYPVLAAMADEVAGLHGARAVSLVFAMGSTIAVYALGAALFNRYSGVFAAGSFVLCGSVIFQSHLATFDSLVTFLIASASWLTVRSVRADNYLWAPVVSVLLVLAFYAKYAGAAYLPVVALLAVAVAPAECRLLVLRRTFSMVFCALSLGYFVLALWGQSLVPGIVVTTFSRVVLNPASSASLLQQVAFWVGPWLLLAALGVAIARPPILVSCVLVLGALLGPLQQIHIGEATSLAKHLAFGMIFACPLIGLFVDWLWSRSAHLGAVAIVSLSVFLGASGVQNSSDFLTGWVDGTPLTSPLARLIANAPGKVVLGEQNSPERYALRNQTDPSQWADTYYFAYGGQVGFPAYRAAIDESSFGVIYLARHYTEDGGVKSMTPAGGEIFDYLIGGNTPYQLVDRVDRKLRGDVVGQWYLFVPKVDTVEGLQSASAHPPTPNLR